MNRLQLAALASKYETLVELRRTRDEAIARGLTSFPPEDRPMRRARMRQLATHFPGSLRELDDLDRDALHGRLASARAALDGAPVQPWMQACSLFHEALAGAFAMKRGGSSAFWAERKALHASVLAPPTGRLLDVVWTAVADALGLSPAQAERLVYPNAPQWGVRR